VTVIAVACDWKFAHFMTPRSGAKKIAQPLAPEIGKLQVRSSETESENAALHG